MEVIHMRVIGLCLSGPVVQVTQRSGINSHGPLSDYTTFSLPACIYDLMKNSLQLVDREGEDLLLVFRCVHMVLRHYLKVDGDSIWPLWDVSEGQQ